MNWKMTPLLLGAVLLLALVAYLTERAPHPAASNDKGTAVEAHMLDVELADILRVRVKRDYWNTFTLVRGPDGNWKLNEPSSEPAAAPAVNALLNTLITLPVVSTIDMLADDTERYREYGLWEPAMEITLMTAPGDKYVLRMGGPTADGKGVYSVVDGRNKVYVTSKEAMATLGTDLSAYRTDSKP